MNKLSKDFPLRQEDMHCLKAHVHLYIRNSNRRSFSAPHNVQLAIRQHSVPSFSHKHTPTASNKSFYDGCQLAEN